MMFLRNFSNIFLATVGFFLLIQSACTGKDSDNRKSVDPIKPSWESIAEYYTVPQWYKDGKFGIFMHWGLYAVPGKQSEWYARHMYSNQGIADWHRENYGPQDQFGYKDFIPLFRAEKFDPMEWAELFKKAGARYIVPTAEHHDGFALWDSDLTRWDAMDMGPKRDLIGDLGEAVRKVGLKYGVSNHNMEHFNFMYPELDIKSDLFDPEYADFYGPPAPRDSFPSPEFQENYWYARTRELIDKYQPDMVWFDNGINPRELDSIKLKLAAYYYNSALEWGKQVSLSSKGHAYLEGSIRDYERQHRSPGGITEFYWQTDNSIHQRWGYLRDARYRSAGSVVIELVENVSKNGNLLFNISPMADGTIPQEQQDVLLGIGKWLDVNGEAIYGSSPWVKFGEGPSAPEVEDPETPMGSRKVGRSPEDIRFTTRDGHLYAILLGWPEEIALITSLAEDSPDFPDDIKKVQLLGYEEGLDFSRDNSGLKVKMPAEPPCEHAYVLRIN